MFKNLPQNGMPIGKIDVLGDGICSREVLGVGKKSSPQNKYSFLEVIILNFI